MRASSTMCLVLCVVLLGACERSSGNEQLSSPAPQVITTPSPQVYQPQPFALRSLGQPRLSQLIANDNPAQRVAASPSSQVYAQPPVATFSRYDGQLPRPVNIPSNVSNIGREPVDLALAQPSRPDDKNPTRDIVDIGLNSKIAPVRPAAREKSADRFASITQTRAPTPRPVAATPTPVQRPVLQVQAPPPESITISPEPPVIQQVLPPQPSIAVLQVRGLSAPVATTDTPPTGLPTLRSVEEAVPLGALPASLGVANIETGEAALPQADQLEQSVADDSGTLTWTQAASLIRAGEVESATDVGEFEVLLLLCSGRGVLTIQPTPTALADLEKPKVVCGKSVTLTSQ